jgi:hypothetical protein
MSSHHASDRRAEGSAPTTAELEKSKLYSEEIGLDLAKGGERDLFLWFLASQLFGQPISEEIARRTFHAFVDHGLTTPTKILDAGWNALVNPIMREGGYVRYDESKSRSILNTCQMLVDRYDGKVSRIHADAEGSRDLEARLKEFTGFGPVTVEIFLRDVRPFWPKADTPPGTELRKLARRFRVDLDAYDHQSLQFARVQSGLIRLRHKAPPSRRRGGA